MVVVPRGIYNLRLDIWDTGAPKVDVLPFPHPVQLLQKLLSDGVFDEGKEGRVAGFYGDMRLLASFVRGGSLVP